MISPSGLIIDLCTSIRSDEQVRDSPRNWRILCEPFIICNTSNKGNENRHLTYVTSGFDGPKSYETQISNANLIRGLRKVLSITTTIIVERSEASLVRWNNGKFP